MKGTERTRKRPNNINTHSSNRLKGEIIQLISDRHDCSPVELKHKIRRQAVLDQRKVFRHRNKRSQYFERPTHTQNVKSGQEHTTSQKCEGGRDGIAPKEDRNTYYVYTNVDRIRVIGAVESKLVLYAE